MSRITRVEWGQVYILVKILILLLPGINKFCIDDICETLAQTHWR